CLPHPATTSQEHMKARRSLSDQVVGRAARMSSRIAIGRIGTDVPDRGRAAIANEGISRPTCVGPRITIAGVAVGLPGWLGTTTRRADQVIGGPARVGPRI